MSGGVQKDITHNNYNRNCTMVGARNALAVEYFVIIYSTDTPQLISCGKYLGIKGHPGGPKITFQRGKGKAG